jgi:hypothetical protein
VCAGLFASKRTSAHMLATCVTLVSVERRGQRGIRSSQPIPRWRAAASSSPRGGGGSGSSIRTGLESAGNQHQLLHSEVLQAHRHLPFSRPSVLTGKHSSEKACTQHIQNHASTQHTMHPHPLGCYARNRQKGWESGQADGAGQACVAQWTAARRWRTCDQHKPPVTPIDSQRLTDTHSDVKWFLHKILECPEKL